jgi:hypothetical protein
VIGKAVAAGALVLAAASTGVVGLAAVDASDPLACLGLTSGPVAELNPEQAQNARLIVAVGEQRGVPRRGLQVALMTAMQESGLRNLDYGDRDSLGLFQQRPSQGWGTTDEVRDPVHATNAFYDALAKVDGYEQMEITEAAQAVQRSGFPDAYADHEADARTLASALTGNSPEAFSCRLGDADDGSSDLGDSGLTARADTVRRDLVAVFPGQDLGGFAPGGVSTGHMEGSAHYEGRAIDVFVRPVSAVNRTRGWAIAQYLVSQADRLSIRTVIFDDRIWTSGRRSGDGWRDYDPPERSGDPAILEHRDHVHVDVFE